MPTNVPPPLRTHAADDDVVLGLWDGHDAGAALVAGGRVLAAESEERLTRVKNQGGFPTRAIEDVLRIAGISAGSVTRVAMAGRFGRLPARLLDRRYAAIEPRDVDPLSPASRAFAQYQSGLARLPGLRHVERLASASVLSYRLASLGLGRAALTLVDHHTAHALTAASHLGCDGLVVTSDGYGDGVSHAVWEVKDGRLSRRGAWGASASVALLYGALTRDLGFREGEEGKVTGLAGSVIHSDLRLDDVVGLDADGTPRVDQRHARKRLAKALADGVRREEVAFALQSALERVLVASISKALENTGHRALGVAGGLFANVSLNGRLATLDLDRFVVFPAMTDQGLCVGAALGLVGTRFAMDDLRLGHGLPDASAAPEVVAARLAEGAIIGVARGRMEFGPRALGSRSILFSPATRTLADRLNSALDRDRCMPYAPVLRRESWDALTTLPLARIERAANEMTLAVAASETFRRLAPAAVHDDGTARPQLVTRAPDPWLHAVLEAFERRTGCPALVNTSFNRHREPIVRTGDEALATARAARLDALVVGDHWLPSLA